MTEKNNSLLETKFNDNAIISFDFFETLVEKSFFQHSDLFDLMSQEVYRIAGDQNFNFKQIRVLAEQLAYKNKQESETIDLNDIYAEIQKLTNLDQSHIMEIEKLELCYEQKFYIPKAVGKQIYTIAKAFHKKIIIVADTHLPRFFVESMLERFGYDGYTELILPSELGMSKKSGKIFKHIAEKMYCDPKYILHIGDDELDDVKIPQELGFNTMPMLSSNESFANTYYYKNIWENGSIHSVTSTRLINGLLASKFHSAKNPGNLNTEKTAFNNDPYRVGYFGLGPLVLGYIQWILKKSQEEYVKHLYFPSTNGTFMKSAYDILAKHYSQAPMSYDLLTSSKIAQLPHLVKYYDLYEVLEEPFKPINIREYFFNKFGICIKNHVELIEKYGFDLESFLVKENHGKQILSIFEELHPFIIKQAQNEKDYYSAYLKYNNLPNPDKSAIVDITSNDNIQSSLSDIAKQKIGGYYLMTYVDAIEKIKRNGLPISGYLGNFEEPEYQENPLSFLFQSIDEDFSTFELNGNTLNPLFSDGTYNEDTQKFLTDVQNAALDFIADFEQIYNKHIPQLYFSHKQVFKPISYFLNQRSEFSKLYKSVSSTKTINKMEMSESLDENQSDHPGLIRTISKVLKEIKKAL